MHLIFAIILLAVTLLFGFSESLHMPETPAMIIAVVVIAGAVWATLLSYRSSPTDERQHLHRAVSFQWATLLGSLVLAVGALVQIVNHELDPFLIYAVAAMAAGRLISHFYQDKYN